MQGVRETRLRGFVGARRPRKPGMQNKLLVSAGSGEGICPWLIDREVSFLLEAPP